MFIITDITLITDISDSDTVTVIITISTMCDFAALVTNQHPKPLGPSRLLSTEERPTPPPICDV